MRTVTINGDVWRVVRVPAGDPRLIDRTGTERPGTTNPKNMTIALLDTLSPPLLDKVVLHEVAHAVTLSWHLLPSLRGYVSDMDGIAVEEWSAQLMENHALESLVAASEILGRPVCVSGVCL